MSISAGTVRGPGYMRSDGSNNATSFLLAHSTAQRVFPCPGLPKAKKTSTNSSLNAILQMKSFQGLLLWNSERKTFFPRPTRRPRTVIDGTYRLPLAKKQQRYCFPVVSLSGTPCNAQVGKFRRVASTKALQEGEKEKFNKILSITRR